MAHHQLDPRMETRLRLLALLQAPFPAAVDIVAAVEVRVTLILVKAVAVVVAAGISTIAIYLDETVHLLFLLHRDGRETLET